MVNIIINQKVFKPNNNTNINMLPGDLQRSPDESFLKNLILKDTIVFIDEAFLSKLSRHFGEGIYIKFDRFNFAKKISDKEKLNLLDTFLYIAPPFQGNPPTKEEELKKEGYDHLIRKLKEKKIIVREGRCQRLNIDGKFQYSQKAVDVYLAMDLTNTPVKYPKIDKIILISSDSDFVPVIKNLKENDIKTILYTYYEKTRNSNFSRSNHLIKSVYKYKLLCKEDMLSCLLE